MSEGGTRSGGYKPEDREKALEEDEISNRVKAKYKKAKQANRPVALPTPPSENLELDESFQSANGDEDEAMAYDSENGTNDLLVQNLKSIWKLHILSIFNFMKIFFYFSFFGLYLVELTKFTK